METTLPYQVRILAEETLVNDWIKFATIVKDLLEKQRVKHVDYNLLISLGKVVAIVEKYIKLGQPLSERTITGLINVSIPDAWKLVFQNIDLPKLIEEAAKPFPVEA